MSDRFDRPSCNLADLERLRHTPVECRCGKGICHEGQHECACGGRWESRPSAHTPDSPKISPEDAQPRESASEAERFTLQQEFAAADYLEQRLADADMPARRWVVLGPDPVHDPRAQRLRASRMIRRTLTEILTRAKAELSTNRTITNYQLPDPIDALVDWQLETGRGR